MKIFRGLEKEVMKCIWASQPIARSDIVEKCFQREPTYIYKVIHGLEKQGFIRTIDGRYYKHNAIYETVISVEEYVTEIISEYNPDMMKVIDMLGKKKK